MILVGADLVVAKFLIATAVGVPPGGTARWQVTNGSMPKSPDDFITTYDAGADPDGRNLRSGRQVTHPLVQVRVRGRTYEGAQVKIHQAATALEAVQKRVLEFDFNGQDDYQVALYAFSLTVPPAYIGQEEQNQRQIFVLTGKVTLTEV